MTYEFSPELLNNKKQYIQSIFTKIAPYYDCMNDILSLGIHRLWKLKACKTLNLSSPSKIIDLACGTGEVSFYLEKMYPSAEIIGVDFCENMLDIANQHKQKKNSNVTFLQGDILQLPFDDNSFDGVTISYGLRNVENYQQCLKEIYRITKPQGTLSILDMSQPIGFMKLFQKFYCFFVIPCVSTILFRDKESYEYLVHSPSIYLSQEDLVQTLVRAGWNNIDYENLFGGLSAIHSAQKL